MLRICLIGGLAGLAGCIEAPDVAGRAAYTDYCAVCHGVEARGDGPMAGGLKQPPPDLTGLAARNGGVFPQLAVMSQIDGYHRRGTKDAMPEFGDIFEGRTVLIETAPGVMTPTPEVLVELAAYLKSIQERGQ